VELVSTSSQRQVVSNLTKGIIVNFEVGIKKWFAFICLVVVTVTVTWVMYTVNPKDNTTDSGVQACQAIADKAAHPSPAASKKSGAMSDDSYKKNRAVYENSKYADLKAAGTAVIDVVYGMSKDTGTDYSSSMANLYALKDHWASLQRACANHGVQIPSL
jgi:hypothetical protein